MSLSLARIHVRRDLVQSGDRVACITGPYRGRASVAAFLGTDAGRPGPASELVVHSMGGGISPPHALVNRQRP